MPNNLRLADENLNVGNKIDKVIFETLCECRFKMGTDMPETLFGWISIFKDLNGIERFWKIGELELFQNSVKFFKENLNELGQSLTTNVSNGT